MTRLLLVVFVAAGASAAQQTVHGLSATSGEASMTSEGIDVVIEGIQAPTVGDDGTAISAGGARTRVALDKLVRGQDVDARGRGRSTPSGRSGPRTPEDRGWPSTRRDSPRGGIRPPLPRTGRHAARRGASGGADGRAGRQDRRLGASDGSAGGGRTAHLARRLSRPLRAERRLRLWPAPRRDPRRRARPTSRSRLPCSWTTGSRTTSGRSRAGPRAGGRSSAPRSPRARAASPSPTTR